MGQATRVRTLTLEEPSYETDPYGWALHQADLIRQGRLSELDLVNIAVEIESVGRSEYGKLQSAIRIILMHLLKWDHQPETRSRSWTISIAIQRDHAVSWLRENPSLKPKLQEMIAGAYRTARLEASGETDLDLDVFPAACPYSWDEIMQREITWPPSDPASASSPA